MCQSSDCANDTSFTFCMNCKSLPNSRRNETAVLRDGSKTKGWGGGYSPTSFAGRCRIGVKQRRLHHEGIDVWRAMCVGECVLDLDVSISSCLRCAPDSVLRDGSAVGELLCFSMEHRSVVVFLNKRQLSYENARKTF
jgi:hypothetical protein